MDDLVQRAVNFATKAHQGQQRLFNGQPYIIHPIGVAEYVAIMKTSKNKDIFWPWLAA
jgi:(p)ppGpp synthase/HD superfamily hydrolase